MRRRTRNESSLKEKTDAIVFRAFEALPPINVAQTVDEALEKHGADAAGHAWKMAAFARAYGQEEVAEDYYHVYEAILDRQKIT